MAFEGIITSEHKALFKDAIDALLEPTACTVPCKLIYADSKWTDCPNCFTSGTVIKCKNGYKKIEDIAIGDIVYNGTSYTKVNNTSVSLYDGLMYNIRAYGLATKQYATANHKIPIVKNVCKFKNGRRRFDKKIDLDNCIIEEVCAKDIKVGDAVFIPTDKTYHNEDLDIIHIDGFGDISVDADLLFLFGWWVAEGCTHKSKNVREGTFALCASKEQHIADKLLEILLQKFGLVGKTKKIKDCDTLTVTFYSSKLAKWLLCFGHLAQNKIVPSNIWVKLSNKQKDILLISYIHGDGHIRRNTYSITTVSFSLAWQIYDYLLNTDNNPSIMVRDARQIKGVNHQESYNVEWCQNSTNKRVGRKYIEGHGYLSTIRQINVKSDTCFVYNLEVNKIHKYVANGMLVNNCVYDAVGKKSSNRYQEGGPMPFTVGVCPFCHSQGRTSTESTEVVYMLPVWDMNEWVGWKGTDARTRYPDGGVQTMCSITYLDNVKKAKEIIIDTNIQSYTEHRMSRGGEPSICGFGASLYIHTIWEHMK